jgi:hypothetical protein
MADTRVMDPEAVAQWNHKVSEWHVLYGKLHDITMAALNDHTSPVAQSTKVLSQLYMPWQDALNWGRRLADDPVSYDPSAKEALTELGKRIDSAVLLANAMEPYYREVKSLNNSWWPSMKRYYEDLIMDAGEYIYTPGKGSDILNDAKELWDSFAEKAKAVVDRFGLPVILGVGVFAYLLLRKKK